MSSGERVGRRSTAAAAIVGGAVAGALDGAFVGLAGRLALGPLGVGALIGLGAAVGAVLALPVALVLASWPRRRPLFALEIGVLAVAAARLWVQLTTAAGPWVMHPLDLWCVLDVALLAWAAAGRLGNAWAPGTWLRAALLWGSAMAWVGLSLPRPPPAAAQAADRANVMWMTLSEVRADRFGAHPIDTPAHDRLAREGASYAVMISPGADPAFGAAALFGVGEASASLPCRLAAEGYRVAAFVGEPLPGLDTGCFEVFDDDATWPKGIGRALPGMVLTALGGRAPHTRRAADVVARATRFLATTPEPWAVWVHVADAEPPYEPPMPFDERYLPADGGLAGDVRPLVERARLDPRHEGTLDGVVDPAWVEARYDGEVAYADTSLADLLGWLDRAGASGRTLVAYAGLSGASLSRQQPWFGRAEVLDDGAVRVPAGLRWLGHVAVGEVVEAPRALPDLGRRVEALLGMSASPASPDDVVRLVSPAGAVLRTPDALVSWSPAAGYRAWRTGAAASTAPWTPDRLAGLVAELPGDPARPLPTRDELERMVRTLRGAVDDPLRPNPLP